jgi:hypothetical protein
MGMVMDMSWRIIIMGMDMDLVPSQVQGPKHPFSKRIGSYGVSCKYMPYPPLERHLQGTGSKTTLLPCRN